MKTEKKFNKEKRIKFTQSCNLKRAIGKISVLEIADQTFEAGEFLKNL